MLCPKQNNLPQWCYHILQIQQFKLDAAFVISYLSLTPFESKHWDQVVYARDAIHVQVNMCRSCLLWCVAQHGLLLKFGVWTWMRIASVCFKCGTLWLSIFYSSGAVTFVPRLPSPLPVNLFNADLRCKCYAMTAGWHCFSWGSPRQPDSTICSLRHSMQLHWRWLAKRSHTLMRPAWSLTMERNTHILLCQTIHQPWTHWQVESDIWCVEFVHSLDVYYERKWLPWRETWHVMCL